MRPSFFLFDLGGVVCGFHRDRRIGILAEACGVSPARVDEALYGSGLISSWDSGGSTAEEVEKVIRDRTGFTGTSAELRRIWCTAFTPDPGVLAAVDLVGPERAALFTDNDPLLLAALPEHLPEVAARFGTLLFSCLLGATKPAPAAFSAALARTGADPAATFFVDDRERNVAGARDLGIQAELFAGGPALAQRLTALLAAPTTS
jgi:putative hydrolase of the HAD superfamily